MRWIEKIVQALLQTDGGIRSGVMALGFVAFDLNNRKNILFCDYRKCGKGDWTTSNISEYRGLIAGLQRCIKENIKIVSIEMDSQLIIYQVNNLYRTKNPELIKHRDKVMELLGNFDKWSAKWIPRKQNAFADHLVNLAFEGKKNDNKIQK